MPPATPGALVDPRGRGIRLGALLGRGGEGAVYAIAGEPGLVAKVYHRPLSPDRAAKIEAMANMVSAEFDAVCAWPRGLIMEGRQPRGLLMPRIAGRKELHLLHGPKSRKAEFPEAGFDFLVLVAANVARAFGRLHAAGITVGDVNDRGIMVGTDGQVRLIDCDSFQIRTPRRTYCCDVGSPDYTPPELQGRSLSCVERTECHDLFGLAVVIFRLLFMGRHPFAGIFSGGQLEIHEAIREARYVYGRDAERMCMRPPPGMVPVAEGAGASIACLFERAFSPQAIPLSGARAKGAAPPRVPRPTASEWLEALKALYDNLAICRFNAAHAYARTRSACPWCELEHRYNVDLFNFIPTGDDKANAIDIEAVWKALGAIEAPKVPAPLPESLVRAQPTPAPPALLKLCDEARSLAAEAQRARAVAKQAQSAALRHREASERAVADLSGTSEPIAHLEARIRALKEPEPRYPQRSILLALCPLLLMAAFALSSGFLLAMAVFILGAVCGLDAVMARLRPWMVSRLQHRLRARRIAVIRKDPERSERFDMICRAADEAQAEALRAENIAHALERAAAGAQSALLRELSSETEALDQRLKVAQRTADEARVRLANLAAEASALQLSINERRARLAGGLSALKKLTREQEEAYKKLRAENREAQLTRFLDTHYIHSATIKGITPALKSALASFGIETAADINPTAVAAVPGFGKVRTQRMLAWRNHVSKKFRHQPGLGLDPGKLKAIESKYAAGRLRIARDFTTAQSELERGVDELARRLPAAKQAADDAVRALVQARAERAVLAKLHPARI